MASIFTKIIRREIPAYSIYEDDDFIAFLDIFPIHEGQTLIVPKKEVPSKFSIVETDLLQNAVALAQRIATRIEEKLPEIERCILVIEGLEIDHLHIKLYPIKKNEKKGFCYFCLFSFVLEEIKILLSDEQKS
jgi:histidine triad (HIT) family protein